MEAKNNEFKKADEKFDKMIKNSQNIEFKHKIFMKISDVDPEDAKRFKTWCDRHVEGKQFLGLKVLMDMIERIDYMNSLIKPQLDYFELRLSNLEDSMIMNQELNNNKPKIPKTQGGNK